jgi:hypothetical protein
VDKNAVAGQLGTGSRGRKPGQDSQDRTGQLEKVVMVEAEQER